MSKISASKSSSKDSQTADGSEREPSESITNLMNHQRDLAAKQMAKNTDVQQRLKELQAPGAGLRRTGPDAIPLPGFDYCSIVDGYVDKMDLDASIRQVMSRSGRRGRHDIIS